jgi:hypothetical protein
MKSLSRNGDSTSGAVSNHVSSLWPQEALDFRDLSVYTLHGQVEPFKIFSRHAAKSNTLPLVHILNRFLYQAPRS